MSEIYYECPKCSSTNLVFDVSGATYDPIYQRFTAYVNQENKADCIDCKNKRFIAVRKEVIDDDITALLTGLSSMYQHIKRQTRTVKYLTILWLWLLFPFIALWIWLTNPGKCALIWKKEICGTWWNKSDHQSTAALLSEQVKGHNLVAWNTATHVQE